MTGRRLPDAPARTDEVESSLLTDFAIAFCQDVAEAGYTAGVYFNQDLGYLSYDLSRLTGYELWLAELADTPDFYYDFQVWQYSHTGTVSGIAAAVDRNVSFVSYGSVQREKPVDKVRAKAETA